ncbi:MAG TPA: amino acid ABC transporter permease, partial [Planctomycetaceae bacterium]|nr:amino acid ABC transporter permease [Planctomycetaceae bacterium]
MRYYLFWAGCLLVLAIIPWRWDAAELKVGSKAFTEGVILGELLQQLALDAGVPAEHLRHL